MPELPEVEHVVRSLRRAVLGRQIVAAEIHLPKLVSPSSRLGLQPQAKRLPHRRDQSPRQIHSDRAGKTQGVLP